MKRAFSPQSRDATLKRVQRHAGNVKSSLPAFYPITADAKPDSYKSHRVSGNGSVAVPVNATNSTYGLAEIYGPIGAGVFILLMIGWTFLRKSTQRDYVLEEAPGLTDRLSNIDE